MEYLDWGMVVVFVVSIVGALIWYYVREKQEERKYVAQLENIEIAINQLIASDGLITTNTHKKLASEVLIVEEHNGSDRVKLRGNKLVSKVQVTELLSNAYSSDYRFVPALLTSLGVLGTFTGISFGLIQFNTAGAGVEEITSAANNLLGGMKIAFWTSVLGLFSSIIFTLRLKISTDNADKELKHAKEVFGNAIYCPSPTELLMSLGGETQNELIKLQ